MVTWTRCTGGSRSEQPGTEPSDAIEHGRARRPAGGPLKPARVGHVVPLVSDARGLESMPGPNPDCRRDQVNQLQQAERAAASAADVECPSRERVDLVV